MDGVIDLFSVCMLGIFCNVVDIRTYQCGPELEPSKFLLKFHVEDDANNISEEERHRCVRTRGLAYDLVMWFFETYEVTDNDTQQPMNLQAWFEPHIAHTAVVMVDYVETYEKHYDTDLIDHEFRYQINLCFQLQQGIYHCIEKMMQSLPSDELNTLAYVGPRNLTITKRSESHYTRTLVAVSPLLRRTDLAYSAPEPYHLLFIGYTAGDKAFLGMPENPNEQTSETESGGVSSAGKERESELESDPMQLRNMKINWILTQAQMRNARVNWSLTRRRLAFNVCREERGCSSGSRKRGYPIVTRQTQMILKATPTVLLAKKEDHQTKREECR